MPKESIQVRKYEANFRTWAAFIYNYFGSQDWDTTIEDASYHIAAFTGINRETVVQLATEQLRKHARERERRSR